MKNYARWKTPITNALKTYATKPESHLKLYILAKAVELQQAEAIYTLEWFSHLSNDLLYLIKHISTNVASTAIKLNQIEDWIMVDCFNQLLTFHNTSSMTFFALNAFRKTTHQIAFSVSNKENFNLIFERLVNESGSSKNIHIRATAMELMTKMASLDRLNSTQLLMESEKFFANQRHHNKFVKEYGKEGLNLAIYKGKNTEIKSQLENLMIDFIDSLTFNRYISTLNNISVYTKEFIKKYTDNVFDRIYNKSQPIEDYMLKAYDAVYMSTSEEDAIFTFNLFKDQLKNNSSENLTSVLTAAQSIGKMASMVPEKLLPEAISLILEKNYDYNLTMIGLRDEVMKIADVITYTNNINEVVDLCANHSHQNKNLHARTTGLFCIQEILIFHQLSTKVIERIVSSEFYKHKDRFIDHRILSGETFVLLIRKALELGMEDYIEGVFHWSPKNGVIDDPLEVLNLIGWEEDVRYGIDMYYYKEKHINECPAEDCYPPDAESYCFAQDDSI